MEPKTLINADYLDIIFANRNKQYGGYELRKNYNRRVIKAAALLLLGVTTLICVSFIPSESASAPVPYVRVTTLTTVDIKPVKPIIIPPAKAVQPQKPVPETPPVKTIKTVPPVIVVDNKVKPDEVMPANEILKSAQPGPANNNGTGGTAGIGTPVGNTVGGGNNTNTKATPIPGYVEQMPVFSGNLNAYINSHLHYPDMARNANIEGKVLVEFIVNEDGSVTNAKVVRSIGGGCDEEALNMVRNMPKWKAGKQNGRAVKVLFTLPIKFVLNN